MLSKYLVILMAKIVVSIQETSAFIDLSVTISVGQNLLNFFFLLKRFYRNLEFASPPNIIALSNIYRRYLPNTLALVMLKFNIYIISPSFLLFTCRTHFYFCFFCRMYSSVLVFLSTSVQILMENCLYGLKYSYS